MVRKRVRTISLTLAAILAFGLVGCSSSSSSSSSSDSDDAAEETAEETTEEAEETEAEDSEEEEDEAAAAASAEGKVTITYWTTNRHDQEYMTTKIDEFNESNDHIYIDYEVYSDNYSQMLDLAFSTDSGPDVFMISDFGTEYEKGYYYPLDEFMDDEYKARFGDNAFAEGINMMDGVIYSLPYTASAVRLFYNIDIFERVGIENPPTTLAELVEDATLITEQLSSEGIYGIAGNYKTPSSSVTRTIDPVVQLSGGVLWGFDFSTGTYDFSSYKEVLELFQQMYATGVAFPGSESLDIDPLRSQFAAGNIGMYFSVSHAEPGVYTSQFETDVNWGVAQVPSLTGEQEGYQNYWFGGSYAAINSATEYPEYAWEVMEYLHSDEVMSEYYTLGLGTVMIESAVENADPPSTIEEMPDLAMGDQDAIWPTLPVGVTVEGSSYYDVMVECIFGLTDIDSAIEDLNTRYNAAYDAMVEAGEERIVYPNFTPLTLDTSQ